jgi:hypothetical protein
MGCALRFPPQIFCTLCCFRCVVHSSGVGLGCRCLRFAFTSSCTHELFVVPLLAQHLQEAGPSLDVARLWVHQHSLSALQPFLRVLGTVQPPVLARHVVRKGLGLRELVVNRAVISIRKLT